MRIAICVLSMCLFAVPILAQHHHAMELNAKGMVMNENEGRLPDDCKLISAEYQFKIYAGVEYSNAFADKIYGYSDYELRVAPCAKVTVTLINSDAIRHQWMLHGLPRYIYDQGMFHLEAAGGEQVEGTFIVPSDHKSYLIHCDISQHMEKGMKAQLVVGKGDGDLWSIPGLSDDLVSGETISKSSALFMLLCGATLISFFIAFKR